jgi:dGTPase
VYLGPRAAGEHRRARETVDAIFDHLSARPDELPPGPGDEPERITDYVAGMTDRFALAYAERLA